MIIDVNYLNIEAFDKERDTINDFIISATKLGLKKIIILNTYDDNPDYTNEEVFYYSSSIYIAIKSGIYEELISAGYNVIFDNSCDYDKVTIEWDKDYRD